MKNPSRFVCAEDDRLEIVRLTGRGITRAVRERKEETREIASNGDKIGKLKNDDHVRSRDFQETGGVRRMVNAMFYSPDNLQDKKTAKPKIMTLNKGKEKNR